MILFAIFIGSLVGHYLTGWNEFNNERIEHNEPPIPAVEYIQEGHFLQSLFENWESEFLQMGAYVLLTVFLFQKGSSDSKRPGRDRAS